MIVDERPVRCAAGAPTRIPTPIVGLTILTLVDVLVLFGTSVAVMALVVSATKSDRYWNYDDGTTDFYVVFALPTLLGVMVRDPTSQDPRSGKRTFAL